MLRAVRRTVVVFMFACRNKHKVREPFVRTEMKYWLFNVDGLQQNGIYEVPNLYIAIE